MFRFERLREGVSVGQALEYMSGCLTEFEIEGVFFRGEEIRNMRDCLNVLARKAHLLAMDLSAARAEPVFRQAEQQETALAAVDNAYGDNVVAFPAAQMEQGERR